MKVAFPASVQKGIIVPHPAYAGKAAVAFSRLKPGETVTVTVESEKKARSLQANRRYWGLLVPAFSEWAGYEEFPESAEKLGMAPKDSAHEVLKAMFIPERTATLPDGTEVKIRPSTAKLTTAEMANLQDQVERFLNSQGIYLPADERF